MDFNVYNIERLEMESSVLHTMIKDLENILLCKIRRSTIAYNEIRILMEKTIKRREDCKIIIEKNLSSSKNIISQLKINTATLQELFFIKKEFELNSIDCTINVLIDNFKFDLYYNDLSKIDIYELPRNLIVNFENTKFIIGISEKCECKRLDHTDDLVIHDNIEYLDLRNFKLYNKKNSEYYSFSPNFTLGDLDDFFDILFG
ncbi:hypothetical protein DZA35_00960 [Arcobacter sp. HD9-500m-PIT-SAG03]|nr:hypothetical protein DZA35_00960 [Arcobacter sp. HD9-500m-PIT-SAG03]